MFQNGRGDGVYRILVILLSVPVMAQSAGMLKALGQHIVDSTNTPVLLRGVGLGGWLVPEGYMLHVPGYGSPGDIESRIRTLIGDGATTQFYQLYRSNYVSRGDIARIAGWGFNSIRLPFNYRLLYNSTTQAFSEEGFAVIDSLVVWCEDAGMYVILDMHCAPGGQNKDNISDSDGSEARLWTEPGNQALTIKIWKEIARRYVGRSSIAGYDLLNEPVLPSGYSNTVLKNFYKQLTDSIRTIDSGHIVFLEGNWYATDFNLLTPPFLTNMVYSFHKYWNETSAATIQSMVTIRTQYFVPLWMGESGENSNPWFYETVRLLEQYNIGWCWWTHKKVGTITSPFSSPISADYQAVLNYWNGQGPQPSQQAATNALFHMAEKLSTDSCVYHPDVVKSLCDLGFGNQSTPFKPLSIPGIIDAVDYDFGTNGIAYWDADYKNTGGLGGPAYNQGGEYRNDGVDIERCSDPQGAAFDVGWINANEWLVYSAAVAHGGMFRVRLRVASNSAGGQLRLYADGNPVSNPVSVPLTGGWQSWSTMTIDGVQLSGGQHQIAIYFLTGGFNINRMEFEQTSTGTEGLTPVPSRPRLMQNFPNPFNPTTEIAYYLPHSSVVRLSVFTPLGQEVAVLVDRPEPVGEHTVRFDGSRLSSGMYFYRLDLGGTTPFSSTRKMSLVR